MLSYGLYARKSDDDRRITEKSTKEQVTECKAMASADGLRIDWLAEESKSAMKPHQRPRYSQLIKLVRKGSINGILCWHVNRLVRNMEEGGELVQLVVDGLIKEVRTPHATYTTGESIWPLVIEAASATQFSIDQSRTVKRAMEGNFKEGGCNHKANPGYRNIRNPMNSKRGLVEPDEQRFFLIRKAWDLMLTRPTTFQDIVRALEVWGYLVKATPKLPERPLSYQSVRDMFLNPFYAGFVRQRGQLVKGRHVAMVTVDEFERVQRILEARTFKIQRKHEHAFAGLMRCGYCGQHVTGEWKRLTSGKMWQTYHCSDSYDRCTAKGLAAEKVLEQLSGIMLGMRVDPRALAIAAKEIRRSLSQHQNAIADKQAEQKRALETLESQLGRLEDMWLSGMLTDPERYKLKQAQLLARQEKLTLALADSGENSELIESNLDRAVEYLKTGYKRFVKAEPEQQCQIMQALGTFAFYGHEKMIDLRLRPILREIIVFLKEVTRSLELSKTSFHKQKQASFEKQFVFGGTNTERLEVPASLLKALGEDQMPSLNGGTLYEIDEEDRKAPNAQ